MASEASNLIMVPAPALQDGSVIRFDPSQQDFFDDTSRVQVVNWHRQKGKDFTAAAKTVDHGLTTGQNWYITSLTQRQADATFQKCDRVFEAYKRLLQLKGKATFDGEQYEEWDEQLQHLFVRTARKLILPKIEGRVQGEIVALPGRNPDTLAGLTGNIIFTEFGLFSNGGYQHWRTIFPLSTRGFMVIVISTPRGKKHKFYELCTDNETYSYHFCPLTKSVAEDGYILQDNKGRPCSIEEFKKIYHDDAGFDREYECQFTGDLDALIPWANLLSAQDPECDTQVVRVTNGNGWRDSFFDFVRALPAGRLEIGWDVARHNDLSVVSCNLARRDGKKLLAGVVVMKGCTFELQRHIVMKAMDARGGSVGAGDATGLGMDSNETMKQRYRESWDAMTFNEKTKSLLGSTGRTMFQDGTQRMPPFMVDVKTKFIATDLYSIQCTGVGEAEEGEDAFEKKADKRLFLSETENELEPDSHCDIAYSLLLAERAGSLLGGKRGVGMGTRRNKPAGW